MLYHCEAKVGTQTVAIYFLALFDEQIQLIVLHFIYLRYPLLTLFNI